jgi:hypothetical protein
MDSTAVTVAMGDVEATIYITFEYDDTQATQIKTVYIPLNAYVGASGTVKPASLATIPALDSELPESSKTYRDIFIVVQGNINDTASTTDSTVSMQIDTYGAYVSSTLEMGATSDYWVRFVWDITALGMTTNATHSWYIWGSIARFNHPQVWMVVTYEFDASASTGCYVSVMIPAKPCQIMQGTASTDFARISTDFYIAEPATIATKSIAFYAFWEQAAAISTLNLRVGTGSFVTYTDASAVMCGGNGAMVRNDGAYTLARGKNTLVFDSYRSDAADWAWGLCGFWILTYTCSKPANGYGAANHTVRWNAGFTFDGATAVQRKTAALTITIPETKFRLNGFGAVFHCMQDSTNGYWGGILEVERTNAAGQWSLVSSPSSHTDPETGLHTHVADCLDLFKRWPNDVQGSRIDPEGTYRWSWHFANASTGHTYLDIWFTYHSITFTVNGTVNGSGGGTVNLTAHHAPTGEIIGTASRSGNGTYSIDWYDNVDNCYAEAVESSALIGRTADAVAAGTA